MSDGRSQDRTDVNEKVKKERRRQKICVRTWRGAGLGLGQGTEWNRDCSELSQSSSSANGEDGGSGEEAGVARRGGVLCAEGVVPWTISLSITGGVIWRRGRGGGDGVRGRTRFRRDGETTRPRRAGGDGGSAFSVRNESWTSAGREGPRRGCAWRARSAAATSSRVADDDFVISGQGLLYLERGARGGADVRMKAS
jgi:hypothetical protein